MARGEAQEGGGEHSQSACGYSRVHKSLRSAEPESLSPADAARNVAPVSWQRTTVPYRGWRVWIVKGPTTGGPAMQQMQRRGALK
jgi:hypothetical protein